MWYVIRYYVQEKLHILTFVDVRNLDAMLRIMMSEPETYHNVRLTIE